VKGEAIQEVPRLLANVVGELFVDVLPWVAGWLVVESSGLLISGLDIRDPVFFYLPARSCNAASEKGR
jgi:hypothetical protein